MDLFVDGTELHDAVWQKPLAETGFFEILLIVRNVEVILDVCDFGLGLGFDCFQRLHSELDFSEH